MLVKSRYKEIANLNSPRGDKKKKDDKLRTNRDINDPAICITIDESLVYIENKGV